MTDRLHHTSGGVFTLCVLAVLTFGCEGQLEEIGLPDSSSDADSDAGAGDGGDSFDADRPFDSGSMGDAGFDAGFDAGPPCNGVPCGVGERCDTTVGGGECVPRSCEELACSATERCDPAPTGSGNTCVDISCDDDLDCPLAEYCNRGVCAADRCVAGRLRCTGSGALRRCLDNGRAFAGLYLCGGDAYFDSTCQNVGVDDAFCGCEDDWDCPAFTVCEAGRCEGTGQAPTCFLPPAELSEVLPQEEPGFPWGGTSDNINAVGSSFANFSQVVMTPVVANLDDDNGDGLVNERDFPEIIFTSFRVKSNGNGTFARDGVLRAVHGGGPDRGDDYFAVCGNQVWREGDPLMSACPQSVANLDPSAGLAVGDLDGDGVPEIVAVSEAQIPDPTPDATRFDRVLIFGADGTPIATSPDTAVQGENPGPAIANIDGQGLPEVILGRIVFKLELGPDGQLRFADRFEGTLGIGNNGLGPLPCVADLDGDGQQEVVAGSTAYRLPMPPPGVSRQSECSGAETSGEHRRFCRGELTIVWDSLRDHGSASGVNQDGFCAIADVMGANASQPTGPANPLDGVPEVVLVTRGEVQILDGRDGRLRYRQAVPSPLGGAPNVDDFDGDGFPEIGSAFDAFYTVIDLQPATAQCPAWNNTFVDGVAGLQGNPARQPPSASCNRDTDCGGTQFACNEATNRCVCLHNGWRRKTEDDSSRVTGSSVFDFNGDGAAEVIYNDECYFRMYQGLDGAVVFRELSESRTRIENPVVADVDNDGNAEIVFAASNESRFCSEFPEGNPGRSVFNNGLEVWGDRSDRWVSARRIYNQHSYHVTNVTESGAIPLREPESWQSHGGRSYNSYRSQPRQRFGIAPDLVIDDVQFSSPGAACGNLTNNLNIALRIRNAGDLRVGPGVRIGFRGNWVAGPQNQRLSANAGGTPLRVNLQTPIDPGRTLTLNVPYNANNNAPRRVPDELRISLDETNAARECREDNNDALVPVVGSRQSADLTVELGAISETCPNKTVEFTVRNEGSTPVTGATVRLYAGNPDTGGEVLGEQSISGTLAPGAQTTVSTTLSPFPTRSVTVFVVVDPDDTIRECNDANNGDRASEPLSCLILI